MNVWSASDSDAPAPLTVTLVYATEKSSSVCPFGQVKLRVQAEMKLLSTYQWSARKKARALQYAVEERRRHGESTSSTWIWHMDEESIVTDQSLTAVLNYISNEGKPVAEGPIVYSNKFRRPPPIRSSRRPDRCRLQRNPRRPTIVPVPFKQASKPERFPRKRRRQSRS